MHARAATLSEAAGPDATGTPDTDGAATPAGVPGRRPQGHSQLAVPQRAHGHLETEAAPQPLHSVPSASSTAVPQSARTLQHFTTGTEQEWRGRRIAKDRGVGKGKSERAGSRDSSFSLAGSDPRALGLDGVGSWARASRGRPHPRETLEFPPP